MDDLKMNCNYKNLPISTNFLKKQEDISDLLNVQHFSNIIPRAKTRT